nr:restriction endonuclease subunit S [Staphylococcus succinus]
MTNEVKNVPELRFPGYDDEWKEKKLEESLQERKTIQKVTDEIPLLAFASGQGVIDRSERKTNNRDFLTKDANQKGYLLTKKNDIVYNPSNLKYGAIDRNKKGTGVISPIYVTFESIEDPSFMELIVKSYKFQQLALRFEEGTVTKRQSVKPEYLLTVLINVPQKSEQKKIGDFFSKLDRQIELEEQKLEKLEEQKKGYMQKIFSQKLLFKDEKGNNYPEWESRYLNELCQINPKVDHLPNKFLYIDLESVNNGKIEKTKEVNKINAPSRAQRLAKKYDVFYQTVRPYQKNNFINLSNRNDIVVSTGYAQLRPSVQFYYLYSLLLTSSFVNKVLVKCTGTNYPAINSTDLSLVQILSSSVFEEQEKIGNFFRIFDEFLEKQNQKIDRLKERKKGFLQKMFI